MRRGGGMGIEYRRKAGSKIVHFCPVCKQYPTSNFFSYETLPSIGEPCEECLRKQRKGLC
jgi:hypothetical protein